MFAAVRRGSEDRAFWALRTFRLAVALSAEDRYESFVRPPWVRAAIRDHLLGFPDDPWPRLLTGWSSRCSSGSCVRWFIRRRRSGTASTAG